MSLASPKPDNRKTLLAKAKSCLAALESKTPDAVSLIAKVKDTILELNEAASADELSEISIRLNFIDGLIKFSSEPNQPKMKMWTREKIDAVDSNFNFAIKNKDRLARYIEIKNRAEHLKTEIDNLRKQHSVNQIAEKSNVPVSTLYSFLDSVNKGEIPKLNRQAESKLKDAFSTFSLFDVERQKAQIEQQAIELFEEKYAPVKQKIETLNEELTRNIPIVSIMQPNGEMQSPSMRNRNLQFELPAHKSAPPNPEHSDFSTYNGALIQFHKSTRAIVANEPIDAVWWLALIEETPIDTELLSRHDNELVLVEGTKGEQRYGTLAVQREEGDHELKVNIIMLPDGKTDDQIEVAAAWKVVDLFPANQGRLFIPKGRVNPSLTN